MLMGQPPRPPGPTPVNTFIIYKRSTLFLLFPIHLYFFTFHKAQRARARAIQVDRFSRFFFPFLFAVLNGSYWAIFASYL